jgi:hypothetical protein
MQFSLPSNLKEQLIAYDPKLKALARSSKPSKSKKAQYPLGVPEDLIPEHIVEKEYVIQAVKTINQQEASQRYRCFTTRSYDQDMKSITTTKAIVYHFQSMWIAAWLPNKDEDYIFGYTYAFKATQSTLNKVSKYDTNHIDLTEDKIHKYGRTEFYVYTELVTPESMVGQRHLNKWRHSNLNSYSAKGTDIYKNSIIPFVEALTQSIPHWKDHNSSIFDRINPEENNYCRILSLHNSGTIYKDEEAKTYKLSRCHVSECVHLVPNFDIYLAYAAMYSNNKEETFSKTEKVLNTPWFKKYITTKCQLIIEKFNDPKTEYKSEFTTIHNTLLHNIRWIVFILEVYPDCPVDFLRIAVNDNVFNWIQIPWANVRNSSTWKEWISQNMPIDSWFKILIKFAEEREANHKPERAKVTYRFNYLEDTFDMLIRIFDAGKTIEPPKRWRIKELHDHVQSESWKISNPNENLPQDLFPEPIKIQSSGTTWTFFQPIDTHQLAQWGQAVRNCVGSASTYANNVKAKKEFLVLCLVENKPQFTVQLKVSNGVMDVVQIAGVSNASLLSEEREQYQSRFAEALKIRESELCSV